MDYNLLCIKNNITRPKETAALQSDDRAANTSVSLDR